MRRLEDSRGGASSPGVNAGASAPRYGEGTIRATRGDTTTKAKEETTPQPEYDDSYAPISHAFSDPSGRGSPRSSVVIVTV